MSQTDTTATVKGTMLAAHLDWARGRFGDLAVLAPLLGVEAAPYLSKTILATDWIPLRVIQEIDKAIGARAGGDPEETWRELGRHSARKNLTGAYKAFVSGEPHRFFEQSSILHDRFQSFGTMRYERTGERSGRISMEGYRVTLEASWCETGRGYFEEALKLMHAPGPIVVSEVSCVRRAQARCVYELSW